MKYKASTDLITKIITVPVLLFFLFMVERGVESFINPGNDKKEMVLYPVLTIVFLIILIAWIYIPTSYYVSEKELIIKRPAGNVRIPFGEIREIRVN